MKKQIMLILEAGAAPPEWIQILRMGTVKLTVPPGRLEVDPESLNTVLSAWRRRGNDLVIDYEHQTLSGEAAPAAGWIKELQALADGLWARVDWTAKAAAYITDKEYRYFSPVLLYDDQLRPVELLNAGLTNFPATTHLPPLVAKSREGMEVVALRVPEAHLQAQKARGQKYGISPKAQGNPTKPSEFADLPDEGWGDPVNYRYPMPDKAHCQAALARWGDKSNQAPYSEAERAIIKKRITSRAQAMGVKSMQEEKAMPMQKMKGILGLKEGAQDVEILTAMEQVVQQGTALKGAITKALGLKAEAAPEEITAAITALKGGQGKLSALETEVAALKDREATRAAEALVELALKDGKLTPAERELAVADAKRDPGGFTARIALRPKIVPIGDKLGVLTGGGIGGGDEPGPEAPVDQRLAFKAQQLAAKDKIDLATAQAQVLKENPDLAQEYKQSFLAGS